MSQASVRMIQEKAQEVLRKAFESDPVFKSLGISYVGGSIGLARSDCTLKFQFVDSTASTKSVFGDVLNDTIVGKGLAGPGVKIVYGGKAYTILKARQKNYLVVSNENGKNYTIPFFLCRLPVDSLTKSA